MASEDSVAAPAADPNYALGILAKFDPLIKRASRRASYYLTGSYGKADDLAQDVRYHLLRAVEANRIAEPAILPRLITNALRDRIRFEQCRIQLSSRTVCELNDQPSKLAAGDTTLRPEILSVKSADSREVGHQFRCKWGSAEADNAGHFHDF